MLIGVVIAAVWIAVAGVVVAACRAAARGDDEMARAVEQIRRRSALAGVVLWEPDAEFGAGDLRPDEDDVARVLRPRELAGL